MTGDSTTPPAASGLTGPRANAARKNPARRRSRQHAENAFRRLRAIRRAAPAVAEILKIVSVVLLIVSGTFCVPSSAVSAYGDGGNWAMGRISTPTDSGTGALPSSGTVWQGAGKGLGISVYVVDSRVDESGLFESFGAGYDAVGSNSKDCGKGHGTLVASIVAAKGYGVAESATIVPVRVLDCHGVGTKRAVVKGLEWVIANARPASSVVNLSFGGKKDRDIDARVTQLADRGIPVVIAAGNGATDTSRFSPSRTGCDERLAIVVAASTEVDSPWTGSNYGECVSIYAPGTNVRAFGSNGPRTVTGTSFAAPYVAGAIAAYASEYSVTTEEAWRMVIGHSLPAINVGKRSTRRPGWFTCSQATRSAGKTATGPAAMSARF